MTTVLAIDPASERSISDTGWAFGKFSKNTPLKITKSGVVRGGFDGFAHDTEIIDRITEADIVVCEKFVVWEPRADSTPRLIEGVVRFLRSDVVLQPASGKNSLVPDSFLKSKGLWGTKGSGAGHHRDRVEAIRHLYVFLVKQKHIPTLKELSA